MTQRKHNKQSTVHKGPGRPFGGTGKELKKRYSVRAYQTKVSILNENGVTIQNIVDDGIALKLNQIKLK